MRAISTPGLRGLLVDGARDVRDEALRACGLLDAANEHDAAIVYPPGRKPYVLVVLVRGFAEPVRAHRLIADISRAVYEDVSRAR